ncbi:MAG TPA: arylamine N-acetyltransferase [Candidatus Sulfomarinibacteraceae bacterium]|nr:arylamine N-acetyltransferase [Candidatus Sulfomarinibacteraceae bacterium]
MNVNTYLQRINYSGPLTPTADTLRRLQMAHLLAVPFENLSIHWGEPIVLDEELLFDKIVRRGRGGFCYELNGLFARLLRALGFDVAMLSAAVNNEENGFGPEFDHMTLLVTNEERWLVDVGFGDCFLEPLRLDEHRPHEEGERAYRVDANGESRVLHRREGSGTWEAQYRFTLTPYEYVDYAEMCHYHQTSPQSHFTQRRVCSRATPDGRITLSERRLIITTNGARHEQELPDEAAVAAALEEHFGIRPPSHEARS